MILKTRLICVCSGFGSIPFLFARNSLHKLLEMTQTNGDFAARGSARSLHHVRLQHFRQHVSDTVAFHQCHVRHEEQQRILDTVHVDVFAAVAAVHAMDIGEIDHVENV
eukprot:CAMPEP_0197074946 /NCGR_PEP_ID=MMETSP1384-20130603/211364_1 /TAXON_ID=29189 /ORGANISM="Ammonia sp." /LENGTH=108 /DNA_ID=CAMNT_0042513789 /DNA_START=492 /DNA_END=818 /DNA_ORIENTATION=+